MKKQVLILFALLSTISATAQNYLISFAANGASSSIDSVYVENLTQGTGIKLAGTDKLRLAGPISSISQVGADNEKSLIIYPNPLNDYCSVGFYAKVSGTATIEVFDISGKTMAISNYPLEIGNHIFKVSGLRKGIYIIQVKTQGYSYSGKLLSNSMSKESSVTIFYEGISETPSLQSNLKVAQTVDTMSFTDGDILKFTATSEKYSTVYMNSPDKGKTISFTFVPCTDGSGNNYPVVKIGNQTWMAENLRASMYNTDTEIPYEASPEAWKSLTTPAYCWYGNNDSTNNKVYGALYNWYAIDAWANQNNNVCPVGWHVPTNGEWKIMTDYLGGTIAASGKLKETGTGNWEAPNTNATNLSGFSALPCGMRAYSDGSFSEIGQAADFWTATAKGDSAIVQNINGQGALEGISENLANGYSVRCVQDYLPVKSILNTRPVTTLKDSVLKTWTIGIDGNGDADGYLTMAASLFVGDKNPHALPDSGLIQADSRHPEVQLYYSNDNDSSYQARYVRGSGSFIFSMPEDYYSKLFLFFTSAEGSSSLQIQLIYSDTTESAAYVVPDYYNAIPKSDPVYFNLVDDLAKWNKANKMTESNHHYIDGIEITPNKNKQLRAVSISKSQAGYLVFWGVKGVILE
jgi:uncharacterized protein (TIGR02145 family)